MAVALVNEKIIGGPVLSRALREALASGSLRQERLEAVLQGKDKLYRIAEIHKRTGIPLRDLRRWCRLGFLPSSFKMLRQWYVFETEFLALMDN